MRGRTSLALALTACALSCAPTTHIVADWKSPDARALVVQRPLVVFQHSSEALRRSVEDEMATRIPGAVPSYAVIPKGDITNVDRVKERVKAAGYDSVILARLVDVKKQIDVVPGQMVGPLWGTWSPVWSGVYDPGYLRETTVVSLETQLYTLSPYFGSGEGELVWASRTETFDPKHISDSIVDAAMKALEHDFVVTTAAERP